MSDQNLIQSTDKPASRRVVIPKQTTLAGRLAAGLLYALIRSVDATIRYAWTIHPTAEAAIKSGPVIFTIFHNRLALSLALYQRLCRLLRISGRWTLTPPHMAAMVSASRDGGFLSCVLEHFGVQPVRGSTSRRGPQAMLELTTWAERGYDLAVTPDGPRGPREVVQEGVLALAQLTGLPIVPASYRLPWKYVVNSWDRFQVPLPFSRCNVVFAEALRIPREATEQERDSARLELERRMRTIST